MTIGAVAVQVRVPGRGEAVVEGRRLDRLGQETIDPTASCDRASPRRADESAGRVSCSETPGARGSTGRVGGRPCPACDSRGWPVRSGRLRPRLSPVPPALHEHRCTRSRAPTNPPSLFRGWSVRLVVVDDKDMDAAKRLPLLGDTETPSAGSSGQREPERIPARPRSRPRSGRP